MMTSKKWCSPGILGRCVVVALLLLLQSSRAAALPALGCETVAITDRDGIGVQMGLPKLVELLKTLPLSVTADKVPADLQLDFTFSSPGATISAKIRSWADTDAVEVESARVHWFEDFKARTRVIQPMQEADATAFRQQILSMLKVYLSTRTAAIALSSEPEGLSVIVTNPAQLLVPRSRSRTVAVLGCLKEGTLLEGYVTWADGHRESFKQRANQTPGRIVVGGRTTNESPPTPTVAEKEEETGTIEQALEGAKPTPPSPLRGWLVGLTAALLTVGLFLLWLRRSRK